MAMDTLANVKTRLGIIGSADDPLLNLLLDSADRWITGFCGRDFTSGSFTEHFAGNAEFLILANFPLTAVASVKVDPAAVFGPDTVIPASRYVVHSERGVIQSTVGPFVAAARQTGFVGADLQHWTRSPRAVQVVYTASAAAPDDVKQALALVIGHWHRQVKTQVAVDFQNLDHHGLADVSVDLVHNLPLPPDVEQLLTPHRTPRV